MSPEVLVVLVLLLLIALLVADVPVAFALAISGGVGVILLRGTSVLEATLAATPYQTASRFSFVIIPLFIFMGALAKYSRIVEDVFGLAARYLRWLPGGVGIATVAACGAFAAVSGSSIATSATVGRLAISEMRKYGYPAAFAAGIVAAAGTLGVLIPPSIMLVLYGILTGESIGALLVAGFIPGIVSALLYALWIGWRMRRHRGVADPAGSPQGARDDPAPAHGREETAARAEGAGSLAAPATRSEHPGETTEPVATGRRGLGGLVRVGILFTVVIGGIYSGIFTATESAAFGAAAALVILMVFLRRTPKRLWEAVVGSAKETASLTSMVFAIMLGATVFTFFLVSAGIPTAMSRGVLGLDVPPLVVVALILLALVPLGMFLDGISVLLIAVPLTYPIVTALGFDGIWFGILIVKMVELSMITPPIGLNVYVVAGTSKDVSVEDAFRGVLPFTAVDVAMIALLFLMPGIALWLPRTMG